MGQIAGGHVRTHLECTDWTWRVRELPIGRCSGRASYRVDYGRLFAGHLVHVGRAQWVWWCRDACAVGVERTRALALERVRRAWRDEL
jgi:hypothetical protein